MPRKFKRVNIEDLEINQRVLYREYLLCEVEGKVLDNLETIIKISYHSRIYNQEKSYWLLFDSDLLLPLNN